MHFTAGDQFGAIIFGAIVGGAVVYIFPKLVSKVVAFVRAKLGK